MWNEFFFSRKASRFFAAFPLKVCLPCIMYEYTRMTYTVRNRVKDTVDITWIIWKIPIVIRYHQLYPCIFEIWPLSVHKILYLVNKHHNPLKKIFENPNFFWNRVCERWMVLQSFCFKYVKNISDNSKMRMFMNLVFPCFILAVVIFH